MFVCVKIIGDDKDDGCGLYLFYYLELLYKSMLDVYYLFLVIWECNEVMVLD